MRVPRILPRLLLLAVLVCCSAVLPSYATTVSGNLKDLGINNVTGSNSFVRFTLQGYGSDIPRVIGTNAIVRPDFDFTPDANGNISGTIQGNDTISIGSNPVGGTWYRVCIYYQGRPFRCDSFTINGNTFNLNNATPNTTNPAVPAPTGDNTYARIDAGNMPFTGDIQAPNVTATSQLKSTVATGTPPLSVISTTVVPNLNVSQLGGKTAPSGNIVGDTDTQALSGKTLDISANTLKSSTNTAGHYPRNNGSTGYVDNTIQSADIPAINLAASGNGGVTGTLPGASMTAVNLAASGNGGVTGVLPPANEGAGTPSSSKFLRGDGTWAVASGIVTYVQTTASQTSVTATTQTHITSLDASPTLPATGTYRAMLTWSVYVYGGVDGFSWISDGTHTASMSMCGTLSNNFSVCSGAIIWPFTSAGGTSPTFQWWFIDSGAATVCAAMGSGGGTCGTGPTNSPAIASSMQVAIFASN